MLCPRASQRLEEALEEVEGLLLRLSLVSGLPAHQSQPRSESSTAVHVQPDLPAGSEVEGEDDDEDNGTDEDEEGVETILANPLAVLAHASPNGESEKLGDGYFSAGGESCHSLASLSWEFIFLYVRSLSILL